VTVGKVGTGTGSGGGSGSVGGAGRVGDGGSGSVRGGGWVAAGGGLGAETAPFGVGLAGLGGVGGDGAGDGSLVSAVVAGAAGRLPVERSNPPCEARTVGRLRWLPGRRRDPSDPWARCESVSGDETRTGAPGAESPWTSADGNGTSTPTRPTVT
jgi:hypothetical protein